MAITLESNYCKKIGLPGYSSHQFSLSVRTELTDLSQIAQESSRLYSLLQKAVDDEIKESGFLPGQSNVTPTNRLNGNGNGNGNGHHSRSNGDEKWNCSDKQKSLILKIVEEHKLDKKVVDQLAVARFSKGVRQLNKLEASGLIEELIEQYGSKQQQGNGRYQKAGAK